MNEAEYIYTDSKGVQTPVSKMTNSHLLNALLKVSAVLTLNPNGFGDAKEEYEAEKVKQSALKAEVLKRMPYNE